MSRTLLVFLMLAVLLLAGCAADDGEPLSTASVEGAPEPTAAAPAGSRGETAAADSPETGAVGTEPEIISLAWDGSTGTWYCVPDGLNSCSGGGFSGSETFHTLELAGNVSGELTLTWDATVPLLQTLRIVVAKAVPCGDTCFAWDADDQVSSMGTSPLPIEFGTTLEEGTVLIVGVFVPRTTPSPVYAQASVDQPFHIEGVVSVAP